jgi:hypothetical protein
MLEVALRVLKKRLRPNLTDLLEIVERGVLILGSLLVMLWLIEPIRAWIEEHHLISNDAIIALCPLAILYGLRAIEKNNLHMHEFFESETASVIPQGTLRVYEPLDEVITSTNEAPHLFEKRHTADILGITLYSAWAKLQIYLEDEKFRHWDITLACLSPDFAASDKSIPSDWKSEVGVRIDEIRSFVDEWRSRLESRDVSVRLYVYGHLPAIHGFRIEHDHIFCSYIHWQGAKLAKPHQFYEYIPTQNRSPRAQHYRAMFDNWLTAAHRSPPVIQ